MKSFIDCSFLIVFLVFICFTSCKEKTMTLMLNEKAEKFNKFPNEKNIEFKNLSEYHGGDPYRIFKHDSILILYNGNKSKKFTFYNYNLNTEQFSQGYLSKGRGPNEVIGTINAGITDNKLWVYDVTLRKVLITNMENAIQKNLFLPSKEYPIEENYSSINFLDSLSFYGIANWGSSNESIVEKVNLNTNKVIDQYGGYQNTNLKLNIQTLRDVYYSNILAKPSGDKIVLGYRHSDLIEIYDVKTKAIKAVQGPEKYGVTFKEEKRSYFFMGKTKNTRKAFVNGTVTDNYIYLVHSGNRAESRSESSRFKWTYGKSVYVYDWKGNPVKKIILDRYVYSIAVSKDDKTIYSYDIDTGYLIKADIDEN